jgi:hypothetical protein
MPVGMLTWRQRHPCLYERELRLRGSQRLQRAKSIPLDRADHSKVGRNDPCACGSGFKHKRCHGN